MQESKQQKPIFFGNKKKALRYLKRIWTDVHLRRIFEQMEMEVYLKVSTLIRILEHPYIDKDDNLSSSLDKTVLGITGNMCKIL